MPCLLKLGNALQFTVWICYNLLSNVQLYSIKIKGLSIFWSLKNSLESGLQKVSGFSWTTSPPNQGLTSWINGFQAGGQCQISFINVDGILLIVVVIHCCSCHFVLVTSCCIWSLHLISIRLLHKPPGSTFEDYLRVIPLAVAIVNCQGCYPKTWTYLHISLFS